MWRLVLVRCPGVRDARREQALPNSREQVNLMVTHTPHICVQPLYNLIPSVFANHRDPPAMTLSLSRPPQLYSRNIV